MTDDEKKTRRLAAAIQRQVSNAGCVCVLRTDDGKAVAVSANDVELIAVYVEGISVDWIAEDLTAARIRG